MVLAAPEEETVASPHPVQSLCAVLETQRLKAVERLAAHGGAIPNTALRELADLHMALMAAREEIEIHNNRLGWGETDAVVK
jgi:hypothetical protein